MNVNLIKDVLDLIADYQNEYGENCLGTVADFKRWIVENYRDENKLSEPEWEGKDNGRSPESVISTLIVHMNRYAKSYSKSAMFGSDFSSQEDFIFLITLKSFGEMSKMDLIKKNVHEKPAGIQIINRLISQGWVEQKDSPKDKRSKVLKITDLGISTLENQMDKIRHATNIVTGNLTHPEKMELIRLLNKLEDFHQHIYDKNIDAEFLLDEALKNKK